MILMGIGTRVSIATRLSAAGCPPQTPVAFIERGTTLSERVLVTTLADIAAGRVEAPSPSS